MSKKPKHIKVISHTENARIVVLLKADPDACPVCHKKDSVNRRHHDTFKAIVYMECSCKHCRLRWIEKYPLVSIQILIEGHDT